MYLDEPHFMLSSQIVQVFLLILATARPFLLPLQTSIQFTQFLKEQKHCLELTWDEALYSKAQIIKWRNADEFENLFNRIDGFHQATNYMGDIGTIMEGSGFEDCLVESGIYSNAAISKINRGKAYNRGMRAHKQLFEALSRLKWKAFIDWIEENNVNVDDIDEEQVKNAVNAVQNLMKDTFNNKDEFCTVFEHLKVTLCPVAQILERFERNSGNRSDTYVFWNNYLEMVQLLLEYVAFEKEGDIKSHINAFSDLLSYDFACNHLNYSCWGSVYIAEMHQLEETYLDVFAEFLDGKHMISQSTQESGYFSRV